MDTKCLSRKRVIMINSILILFSAVITLIAHALLPASLDVAQFDSILVKWFGFPAVAILYFILIYAQCAMVVTYIGTRATASKLQIGIRFGLAFSMIYLLAMQEVSVESSPISTWGIGFVKFQLMMGIGDALPAMLLCLAIAFFTLCHNKSSKLIYKLKMKKCIGAIFFVAVAFFLERTIAYKAGVISSDIATYPIQVYIWTGCFGILMGFIYVMLYPLLIFDKKHSSVPLRFIAIIGVNWIFFNCFMGLIMKGVILKVLLRSGLDATALFIASTIIEKYYNGLYNSNCIL